jgi:hypothetical protein
MGKYVYYHPVMARAILGGEMDPAIMIRNQDRGVQVVRQVITDIGQAVIQDSFQQLFTVFDGGYH